MLDHVRSLWVLLAEDAVPCCNEMTRPEAAAYRAKLVRARTPPHDAAHEAGEAESGASAAWMPLGLLRAVAAEAQRGSISVTAVLNRATPPAEHLEALAGMKARVVVPSRAGGEITGCRSVVVFEAGETGADDAGRGAAALLRARRARLGRLCDDLIELSLRFRDISLRHPELPAYDERDLITYRGQLEEYGRWLLLRGEEWRHWRVDCLTDRLRLRQAADCGAGDSALAVAPNGDLHVCPAALRAGLPACGHVLEGVSLPNRRLFARSHSLPCAPCRALHCSRCVFQSKLATFEYCVPARNVCLRAHYELEVQASLARAAQEQGLWFDEWQAPEPPACYDPYELIVAAEKDGGDAWSILRLFTGGAQNLTPTMMLSLVHELHGHVHALADLLGAGQAPPAALHARSLLAQAQQRALYGYRDLRLREDCPTLGELLDETRALAERRAAAGQGHSWGGAVP